MDVITRSIICLMRPGKGLAAIFIFCRVFTANAQEPLAASESPGLVRWISLDSAQNAFKKFPKPLLIDFYTSWCGWCKHMMKTTYSDPGIAAYINNWFYPVKFDAETRDTVLFRDTVYVNKGEGPRPPHEFALKFLGERPSYPTTIFLTSNYQYALNAPGYLNVKNMEPLLVYVLENIFRTTPYDQYRQYFEKAFYDSTFTADTSFHYLTIQEALKLHETKPRKMIIHIGTRWCNGCRLMHKTTFTDSRFRKYLEKNFYIIDFDAESTDAITFSGRTFVNDHAGGMPFHSFVTAFSNGNITLPSTIILNESLQLLDNIPFYFTPETLEMVLYYFGDEFNKNESWQEFQKKWTEGAIKKDHSKP